MYTYIHTHRCIYKDVMLVNKVAIAAWMMAIITLVVAMAEWVIDTIIPE